MREGLGVAAGIPPPLGVERVVRAGRDRLLLRESAELTRNLIVVQGATTRSSWSSPTMSAPLRLSTPRTRKGTSLAYTSLPTGEPSPKSSRDDRLAEQADHGDVADVAVA